MTLKKRKIKKTVYYGDVPIGGGYPITIQSMTNTPTSDIKKTIAQIHELEKAGCEIIRSSVPDEKSLQALNTIRKNISIPLIADIHFNYKLALDSLGTNVEAIRINPGNFPINFLKQVVLKAKAENKAIRIGVNSGSLSKKIVENFGHTPKALVESALEYISFFEKLNFENIVISVKSSDVLSTIEAYKLMDRLSPYPLHIGLTEAGPVWRGTIKSSVAMGILLGDGIGDTMRISLSCNPVEEVKVAKHILQSLNLRPKGVEIISCPTCARTNIDVIQLSEKVEKNYGFINKNIKIAVMGCAVNGPGEAKEADIGIAGNPDGTGIIFQKGKAIQKISNLDEFFTFLDSYLQKD
jgi:(E)-4-hydroxy-3-methylbut-2-enyl-diphosphate synthase